MRKTSREPSHFGTCSPISILLPALSNFAAMQVKQEVLMSSLEPAGFVWDLHMPKGADGALRVFPWI